MNQLPMGKKMDSLFLKEMMLRAIMKAQSMMCWKCTQESLTKSWILLICLLMKKSKHKFHHNHFDYIDQYLLIENVGQTMRK